MRAVAHLMVAAVLLLAASVRAADDPHAHHRHMMQSAPPADAAALRIDLPEVVLTNQDDVDVDLTGDVLADRIAVVDFVYTTCTTVCPVLSAVFRQIEEALHDRLGPEVVLVSISVDPNRDTPERLRNYAAKFGAPANWVWLTGRQQNVRNVLEAFGAYTPNFEDHPSMILVGDPGRGEWARYLGFPAPATIVAKVDEFAAARAASGGR